MTQGTQLTNPQPIEVINTSDFKQNFVMLMNGLPFDLTGLTEVAVTLINNDRKTNQVFRKTTGDISVQGDPKQGTLQLIIENADMGLLLISNGKNVDFVCDGPWGRQTFRAPMILSVLAPSVGGSP